MPSRSPDSILPLDSIEALTRGSLRPTPPPILPSRAEWIDLADPTVLSLLAFAVGYGAMRFVFAPQLPVRIIAYLVVLPAAALAATEGAIALYRLCLMAARWVVNWYRWFFRIWPKIVCPECGGKSSLKRYVQGIGCRRCGSTTAYCAFCGKTMQLMRVYIPHGCPHCHERGIRIYW